MIFVRLFLILLHKVNQGPVQAWRDDLPMYRLSKRDNHKGTSERIRDRP
jgi:hypothetical protein